MLNILKQQSLRTKLILAFLLIVLFPLVGTSLYGNWVTSQILEKQAINNAQTDLRLRKQQIEGHLDGVRENLQFLSHIDSLNLYLSDDENGKLDFVAADLAQFVTTHPGVFQARFIDESGMEIIRIEASDDGTVIVPDTQLQAKGDRYYYLATMSFDEGEIYISPVDLNREQGVIQEPHTPTIRYATPIFYENGRRAGILILNLFAEEFLRFVREESPDNATLVLTDPQGYYLVHPQIENEWGNNVDLGSKIKAPDFYPEEWEQLTAVSSGVILPPPINSWQAFWEFLLPLELLPKNNFSDRSIIVHEIIDGGANNHWNLIYDVPLTSFYATVSNFRTTAILIMIAAIGFALWLAILISRNLTAPILKLTADVREFRLERIGHPKPSKSNHQIASNNEVDELASAFQGMSAALETQLKQLTQLNLAGHHIAARIEQQDVLTAVSTATQRIFPVEYLVIHLNNQILFSDGDADWENYRNKATATAYLRASADNTNWHTIGLLEDDTQIGFLCYAPICVGSKMGSIEMCGKNPILGETSTGDLLATIAVQASIALDNAELYEKLAHRRAELQTLLKQLINAQEEERRVIAYDIHDGLIQMLVGARLQLGNFKADRVNQPERAELALKKGLDELASSIVEARRVIEGLRPSALDDLGLVATIRYVAEEAKQACGCDLEFKVDLQNGRLPSPIETTAFRIMQEAITNARKYAQMNRLQVSLVQENECLNIEIRDDGLGFNTDNIVTTKDGGVGLRSMYERAKLLGGECLVESEKGKGTIVQATLPLTYNNNG